jgi:hypothetical protein
MRHIFFGFLFTFWLTAVPKTTFAFEYKPPSSLMHNLASESTEEKFYTTASRLVQQQVDLIVRIEQALIEPDTNRIRSVRGQLIVQAKTVAGFVQSQYKSPESLCHPKADSAKNVPSFPDQLSEPQAQIYCSLYGSSQELLKLAPVLDRLLSRRGELALVRQLPLVSGERQLDPVLAIAPVQRPHLGKPATPFSVWEPNLSTVALPTQEQSTAVSSPFPQTIGRTAKTAIANYIPPSQPAIAPPQEALSTLTAAKRLLTAAQLAFPPETKFTNPGETAAILDRFAYGLDPQEPQTYAKFLELPRTGIFRVLPSSAYQRPLNTLRNRLQPTVSERYPFPYLDDAQGRFNFSLALGIVGDSFGLIHQGVDYSFMIDVGDVPLEKLDGRLKNVASPTREFFLNYQPPKQLDALQVERRRFLTGKDQNWNQNQAILASATAKLNHTYVVRSLQFQLPEIILSGQPISPQEILQIPHSDIILAFRPVRRRSDGSYTVLWRVLHHLPEE